MHILSAYIVRQTIKMAIIFHCCWVGKSFIYLYSYLYFYILKIFPFLINIDLN